MTETYNEFKDIYTDIFKKCCLDRFISDGICKKFYDFTLILEEAEKTTNLTAIKSTPDIILKHYADSLISEQFVFENATVIDIGCGAGFPSIPLAIVRQDITITSLDSTGKKIDFVKAAAQKLGLTNVRPICARAEEYCREHRESFDIAIARAVSRLNVLAELTLPFVKIGGAFIAMKARDGYIELEEASKGIEILGGKTESVFDTVLDDNGEKSLRVTAKITKLQPTPPKYPRAYAKITKKPL